MVGSASTKEEIVATKKYLPVPAPLDDGPRLYWKEWQRRIAVAQWAKHGVLSVKCVLNEVPCHIQSRVAPEYTFFLCLRHIWVWKLVHGIWFQCRGSGYRRMQVKAVHVTSCVFWESTCVYLRTLPNLCENGQCVNTLGSYRCICGRGYKPDESGTHCLDVNECKASVPPCDHECLNTLGSYQCSCPDG